MNCSNHRADDQARIAEMRRFELDREVAFAANGREVPDFVRRDDVEFVGIRREIVIPSKAERLKELAAGALHKEEITHVVQDVQRVEIVEIDALGGAKRRTDGHSPGNLPEKEGRRIAVLRLFPDASARVIPPTLE